MPDSLAGATIRYGGKRTDLAMSPWLRDRVGTAIRLLARMLDRGVAAIDSMGTYNEDSKLPGGAPSPHAHRPPDAIDISGVEWVGGPHIRTLDREAQPELYWRVEACLRKAGFGIVLGWDYGGDHHNHWHCDWTKGVGYAGRSQTLFVNAALDILGYANVLDAQESLGVLVDRVVGPVTLLALCEAMIQHGAPVPVENHVRIGSTVVPYEERGGIAWVPLKAFAESLGATVDVSGYPSEIVVVPR